MDLQNCLNFQRELLYLPPTVTQWQTLHNVTETLPTQKKCACRKKKKIKSTQIGKKKSKINHTDKNKTSINRTYCIMPFSWLEEKFKRFCFFGSASPRRWPETDRILNCNFIGWMWLRPPHSPAPVFHIRHRTK